MSLSNPDPTVFRGIGNVYRKDDPDKSVRQGFRGLNTPTDVSRVSIRRNSGKRIVGGVENADFDIVLGAVHVLWMRGDTKLPTVKDISDFASQVDPDDIRKILAHRRFRSACLERNIQWPANWNEAYHSGAVLRSHLRPEQAQVLAIVLEPTRESFQQKLRKAGINAATWMNWLKEPMFAEAVRVSSENMLQTSQAAVHASVVNGATAGNVASQRLYYELTGRHDPTKQQMLDFTNMVGLLLEVLTRHITDPIILSKVNSDLDRIIGGHNLKEIDVIPANYEVPEQATPPVVKFDTVEPLGADDDIPPGFFDSLLEED
jgi:hypothetical protein